LQFSHNTIVEFLYAPPFIRFSMNGFISFLSQSRPGFRDAFIIAGKLSNILRPHPIFSAAYQKAAEKITFPSLGRQTQVLASDEKDVSEC